jgi:hypothetical protein
MEPGGVEVVGLDERVARDLTGAGRGPLEADPGPPASGAPKWTIPLLTLPAQACHSPMTASICSGVGGAASAGGMGAWYTNRYVGVSFSSGLRWKSGGVRSWRVGGGGSGGDGRASGVCR